MLDLIRQRAQSWGVKIAFGIIIIVFVFWGVGSFDRNSPNVVATAKDKEITYAEFERTYRRQLEQIRRTYPNVTEEDLRTLQLRAQVLNRLVAQSLMEQEATRLNITISDVEVAQAIRAIPVFQDKDGKFDNARYNEILAQNGQAVVEFEQGMKRDLLDSKIRSYISAAAEISSDEARRRFGFQFDKRRASYILFPLDEYTDHITPSDSDIAKYYEENKAARFMEPNRTALRYVEISARTLALQMPVSNAEVEAETAKGPLRYQLTRIFLPAPEGQEMKETRDRLEKILAELQKGGDFAQLAAAELGDPGAGESVWIPRANLPQDLADTLKTMRKGMVSGIVTIPGALGIIRVDGTDPDWEKSTDEINAAVRLRLAEDKALLALGDVRNQAIDLLELNKSLEEIAAALHLGIRDLPLSPRASLPAALNLKKGAPPALLSGRPGTLLENLLETNDGFLAVAISEQKAEEAKPLELVRADIVQTLKEQGAARLAEAAALEALNARDAMPDALKAKIYISDLFLRNAGLPALGAGPEVSGQLFTSPLDAWLDKPVAVPKGVLLAKPIEEVPLNDAEWKQMETFVVPGLTDTRVADFYTLFSQRLREQGKPAIVNPKLVEE